MYVGPGRVSVPHLPGPSYCMREGIATGLGTVSCDNVHVGEMARLIAVA